MENDTLIGQQLGAYTIQSKLGEGGMALVYKAYHERLRREVAIKVILAQIANQADFKVRFEREAQLIARLQHPNIVAVYDFGDYGTLTYLVMQFVGGGTLRDRLSGGRALDARLATLYTIQMGKALHHAHLRGIVHRDVKPQNMLVSSTDPNQLLLSDFGIAKLYDTLHEPTLLTTPNMATGKDSSLTSVGQIVGTADYMAPEQIEARPVDARTDVYSLGVVLFQMLTGEAPFRSTTVQGLLYQHIYTPPPPVREVNPYISEHLAWIVSKAMAKAPASRFQSAEEMAQALEAANVNATYRLAPAASQMPLVGQETQGPITPPFQQRPSLPGSGSQFGAASQAVVQPALPTRRRLPLSYIGAGLVVLLAIVLILSRTGLFSFGNGGTTNNNTVAQSFTETFQNNQRQWLSGSSQGLNGNVNANSYVLNINAGANGETYFPYPMSVGTLPANFTWSVKMEQTMGTSTYYGLAFNLTQNGSAVSCYAFAIDSHGDYAVFKYVPGSSNPPKLTTGTSTHIMQGNGQLNELQVKVQGSNFYFSINNYPIMVGAQNQPKPITDNSGSTPYTGGEPALYVTGPANSGEVSFTVTQAQLTVG